MLKKKIIFMGTPEISSFYLNFLLKSHLNIIAVYTQPPRKKGRGMILQESPVQKLAKEKSLYLVTPPKLNNAFEEKKIINLNPDLIIIMGYGLKIPSNIIDFPKYGCINIHLSLLPRWRGASPIEHALLNGDTKTGVTIFKLVEKMDAGPIISQKSILIKKKLNKKDLTNHLNLIGTKLLKNTLPKIFLNKVKYIIQNENKVTYAKKISSEHRKINFNESAEVVQNMIRAFAPKPSAWFFYKKKRIKIIKSKFIKGSWEASTILNNNFHIGCKTGKICPEIIQKEGKQPMNLDNFLRGFNFKVGDRLNA